MFWDRTDKIFEGLLFFSLCGVFRRSTQQYPSGRIRYAHCPWTQPAGHTTPLGSLPYLHSVPGEVVLVVGLPCWILMAERKANTGPATNSRWATSLFGSFHVDYDTKASAAVQNGKVTHH